MTERSPKDPPMTIRDVADRLELQVPTISCYIARGVMPAPDGRSGRSPWWHLSTIDAWLAARPGRGAGGGRPRKDGTPVGSPR